MLRQSSFDLPEAAEGQTLRYSNCASRRKHWRKRIFPLRGDVHVTPRRWGGGLGVCPECVRTHTHTHTERDGRPCDRQNSDTCEDQRGIGVIYKAPSAALWRTVLGRLRMCTLALCSLLVSDGCVVACEVPASPMSSRRNLNLERKSCQTTNQPAGRQEHWSHPSASLTPKTGNQRDLKHLNTKDERQQLLTKPPQSIWVLIKVLHLTSERTLLWQCAPF